MERHTIGASDGFGDAKDSHKVVAQCQVLNI